MKNWSAQSFWEMGRSRILNTIDSYPLPETHPFWELRCKRFFLCKIFLKMLTFYNFTSTWCVIATSQKNEVKYVILMVIDVSDISPLKNWLFLTLNIFYLNVSLTWLLLIDLAKLKYQVIVIIPVRARQKKIHRCCFKFSKMEVDVV